MSGGTSNKKDLEHAGSPDTDFEPVLGALAGPPKDLEVIAELEALREADHG